jgi:hypothetical protein
LRERICKSFFTASLALLAVCTFLISACIQRPDPSPAAQTTPRTMSLVELIDTRQILDGHFRSTTGSEGHATIQFTGRKVNKASFIFQSVLAA